MHWFTCPIWSLGTQRKLVLCVARRSRLSAVLIWGGGRPVILQTLLLYAAQHFWGKGDSCSEVEPLSQAAYWLTQHIICSVLLSNVFQSVEEETWLTPQEKNPDLHVQLYTPWRENISKSKGNLGLWLCRNWKTAYSNGSYKLTKWPLSHPNPTSPTRAYYTKDIHTS